MGMSDLGNKKVMARNIQRLMDETGKSRNDLCDALGVKYTTLTDWIKGNTYPRIDKIELMANYFGVSKSDLIEDKSDYETFELSTDEKVLIEWYRTAPEHDLDFLRRMMAYSQKLKKDTGGKSM
jgi:transcriptional regulator with XRE-family HTH domain